MTSHNILIPSARGEAVKTEPLLLTLEQTGELLGIPRRTLYTLMNCGRLPRSFRLGKRRLFRRDDLTRWVELGMPPLEKFEVLRRGANR
jgi:excisionase family DNA binding protein